MSRCNNAVRYFSIACLTSCSLLVLLLSAGFFLITDCPNANDTRATLMTMYGIMRFMCELLCGLISDKATCKSDQIFEAFKKTKAVISIVPIENQSAMIHWVRSRPS